MKLKAILVFLLLVLGTYQPPARQHDLRAGTGAVLTHAETDIADPASVPLTLGIEPAVARSLRPIALAVMTALMVGFLIFCLVRTAQAGRACLARCRTRPWFLSPPPALGCVILLLPVLTIISTNLLADDRYFEYSVSAGSNLYTVGDTVHSSIRARPSVRDVAGIDGFSATLYESMHLRGREHRPYFNNLVFRRVVFHRDFRPAGQRALENQRRHLRD